uniref:Cilia and flagella associated protein 65 n=1 Tax=Sander lucioperca TaxID=283035 RepID=A0A8C9XND8_SANLU
MLAESLGPGPLASGAKWKPSGKNIKDPGIHQRQRGGKYRRQASSQRSCLLGLELKPELVWEDWDLGGEFTETLVLKNIHSKLQKLHIRPPLSKFFTLIPQIIVLSPGTSFSMPISFRPLQRYEDSIEFQTKDGSFQVCLRATIPCHALEVPDSVLLPLCAVQNSSHSTFLLKNVSKLQTCFQWECAAPFQLSPEQGLLKPGQECHITVLFQPQEALVYQQQANCKFGEEGDKAESCCTVLLKVIYNWIHVYKNYVFLELGPNVSLSSSVVDFGCVEEGGAVVQTVELVNSSPVEALYQWVLDCSGNSVFSIQPASGTLCPHSHTTLKAVYRPTQPIAHHRRVACLILHRDPMFLDLIGTCHSELQQPAILKPEHLVLYKLHWYRRQDLADTPSDIQQDNNVHLDQQGALCPVEEQSHQRPDSAGVVCRNPMEEYYQSCLGCMDPLSSSSSLSSLHVSVMPSELLFNHKISSILSTSSTSSQPVSITNHTREKLSLVWTAAQDSPFTVSPPLCELAPLKSTSFRVTYDPKQLNTLHGAQLECFAFYKVIMIYSKNSFTSMLFPPWCVTVRVIGHSFQPGKEHFIPSCSLKPPRVVFPALSVLSHQTVLLQNCGDLPLTFCLDHSLNPALAESVFVVPSCGLIQPGSHQILMLRTTPTEDSPKQGFSLHLRLNAAKHTKVLYTRHRNTEDKSSNTPHTVLAGYFILLNISCVLFGHLALQLDCDRGTIASHATMLLRSTVRPHRRAQYLWTISYQMLNARFVSSPPQTVCEVRAKGVFPTLQVIDVWGGGSVGSLSKVHLWKLFSLDSLNEHMLSNPSPAELTYRTPTRHSLSSSPSVFTKVLLDFNFSAAPLTSEPSTFVLMFHNPGSIPVDWAFLFPEDQQIELEYWAETGEFSSAELHRMKVQDNHLFSISPRSGTLLPGQQRTIHFTYSHNFAGTDRFPVVFKLSYGREILLNFQGVTVERDRPYLHFASKRHVFTSVTIGNCSPLRQMYELNNGGAVPVRYEVDMAVLSQLQVDNFNHPLLCCLNPEGVVLPGKTAILEWIFSPLEAKVYHVRIEPYTAYLLLPSYHSPLNPFIQVVWGAFIVGNMFLSIVHVLSITLPPICASANCEAVGTICTKLTRAERRAQRETAKAWRCPEPPQPALLHLWVTAHSHCILEYPPHFPNQSNEHYSSVKPQQPEASSSSTSLPAGLPPPTHGPDRDITMHSLITLASKPITYQLRKTSPSSLPSFLPPPSCPTIPSHPTHQRQVLLSGTVGQKEQHNTVDSEGTAGCWRNRRPTQNTPHTEHVPADMSEDVLLNTLQNLMIEAVRGELVLTAHPRTVILPPFSTRYRQTDTHTHTHTHTHIHLR